MITNFNVLCFNEFLTAGVEVASGVYTKAIQVGKSSDQKLMGLPWSVVEFEKLVEKCRNLQVELRSFADSMRNANTRNQRSVLLLAMYWCL